MNRYSNSVASFCILIISVLIAPLIMIVPPIGIFFLFIAPVAFFALPFVLMACSVLWIILEKNRTKVIPVILLCAIALSFKLGFLWIALIIALIFSAITILLIIRWWKRYKDIFLRMLFLALFISLAINLLTTLNPFTSVFGFFGSGKLATLNIKEGNPCNACQKEKWECIQIDDAENICDNLENIKSCYCCECIKNLKFCTDCFFFWDNPHQCNSTTNKCSVGW